jgi:TolA-binding protein
MSKISGISIVLLFSAGFLFLNCGAPKQQDDFLWQSPEERENYINNTKKSDSSLYARINDLMIEMIRIKNEIEFLKNGYAELASLVKGIQEDIKKLANLPEAYNDLIKRVNDLENKNTELNDKLAKLEQDISENLKPVDDKKEMKPKNIDLGLFNIDKAIMNISKPIVTTTDFMQSYKNALNLFRTRNYNYAMKAFNNLLDSKLKVEGLLDNVIYWMGECNYGKKNYEDAVKYFTKTLNFMDSNKGEDALIMLGQSFEKMGEIEPAREAYQRLLDEFPDSKYTGKARNKLKSLI